MDGYNLRFTELRPQSIVICGKSEVNASMVMLQTEMNNQSFSYSTSFFCLFIVIFCYKCLSHYFTIEFR